MKMTTEAETCRSYEINVVVIHILCTVMVIDQLGLRYTRKMCVTETVNPYPANVENRVIS
jgi:hypothetical protein